MRGSTRCRATRRNPRTRGQSEHLAGRRQERYPLLDLDTWIRSLGAEALWGREMMAGLVDGGLAWGNRLDTEIGYGLPVGSRFVVPRESASRPRGTGRTTGWATV